MNPQVTQPYPQNPVSKLASWDYGIDNTERWYAKTALDWHYAASGLHPVDYNNRLSAIMVATMWSHLWRSSPTYPHPAPLMMVANYSKHAGEHRKRAIHHSWWGLFFVHSVSSVHVICIHVW